MYEKKKKKEKKEKKNKRFNFLNMKALVRTHLARTPSNHLLQAHIIHLISHAMIRRRSRSKAGNIKNC